MRLLVHVEGQTEELFVNDVLAPYLYARGFSSVSARLLGTARFRANRGGIRSWAAVRNDIARHLKNDNEACATTMVDYYALPAGADGWPVRDEAICLAPENRARHVENAIHSDFCNFMDDAFDNCRFVPYVTMHEFEALLFSDCSIFADCAGRPEVAITLAGIRSDYDTPEHINDSPETAPSKRVAEIIPEYQKVFIGALAAASIGVEAIVAECPGFGRWIDNLISLANPVPDKN